ncbi:OprO/OprP family phosphate-selective porin [bacterium]|nr:OprO/OprP family phosphate-selective porin [bacterium]
MNIFRVVFIVTVVSMLAVSLAFSMDMIEPEISATGIGMFSTINYDFEGIDKDSDSGFDFGLNIDFNWILSEHFEFGFQLQTGPGNGQYGIVGPGAELTDMYFNWYPDYYRLNFTLGSFDTPFGEETNHLSNNGDTFANDFILNPLLYSAFAGPMGTLNTLGVMANWQYELFDASLAITNGTAEDANNGDGRFEITARGGVLLEEKAKFYASYMMSDDSQQDPTGFGKEFNGVLGEARINMVPSLELYANYGMLTYGDGDGTTHDNVSVMQGSVKYFNERMHIAGRISMWIPEADNGTGAFIAADFPNPGIIQPATGIGLSKDQTVTRLQIASGVSVSDNLMLKAEYYTDMYDGGDTGVENTAWGIIAGLNGTF